MTFGDNALTVHSSVSLLNTVIPPAGLNFLYLTNSGCVHLFRLHDQSIENRAISCSDAGLKLLSH